MKKEKLKSFSIQSPSYKISLLPFDRSLPIFKFQLETVMNSIRCVEKKGNLLETPCSWMHLMKLITGFLIEGA